MTEQQLTIRGVDMDLWKQVRKEAIDKEVTVGDLLNEIIKEWMDRRDAAAK